MTLCLPDIAFNKAALDASRRGVDVASFCASILVDHLLSAASSPESSNGKPSPAPTLSQSEFNVAEHFQHFPSGSIRFAQRFVDEAIKFPGVVASRVRRGIRFEPNFVFIES